ncbi:MULTISPECIES: TetR/AcrR family transcriptional regulator [unclassified Streptomyces]|uniref:TetR/AcrR family transcriptional regulator n=1 Tax=unclassified Streptomyces TaxID=2593676 RepID=UPI00081E9102|nr:TetR/AcrR family transcriptional regulator [Streptomyces sp. LcepLS]MYR30225.1 TetR family transcriptional regulator [Streptomyces sp. SID4945]SCF49081.1 transcriptional regulator, TetR family [Streptomyces sp. LcepLS]
MPEKAGEPEKPGEPEEAAEPEEAVAVGKGPAGKGRATRRRGAELESAILDAAWEVLLAHGYGGFTYEAIAARAGTSRPVLYRRWAQREDMLLATLVRHLRRIEIPDTGSLRGDVLAFLREVNEDRAATAALMLVQLADYFRDTGTNFLQLRAALSPPAPGPGEVLVARAVARGELPDIPRPARVLDLPLELMRHDLLMELSALPDERIVEIVDVVWLPLLGVTGERAG